MTAAEASGTHGLGATTARLPGEGYTDGRIIRARIEIERQEARLQARIAERQAAARLRQDNAEAKRAAREKARQARADRRAAAVAWCQARTVDLLFVPVIGVPGVLSWAGMADYGQAEFGTPGLSLPALSEGGMWAFAAATTITCRNHSDKPAWHLRLGTLIFAAYGAALNFLHGLGRGGLLMGISMALISVAGVTAHQLITAGARRSRAERDQTWIDRAASRRERAARRAAVRSSRIQLDGSGQARLVFEAGTATLSGRRLRRRLAFADHDHRQDNVDRQPARVDRTAVVAELADQIRDAVRDGAVWRPNYTALMAATGFKRSWCEKVVHDARSAVLEIPARTDNDDPMALRGC
jgi:hypothetical protein